MYTTDIVLHEIPKYLKDDILFNYTYLSKKIYEIVDNNFVDEKYKIIFLKVFFNNINNLEKLKLLIKLYPNIDLNFDNDSIYLFASINNNIDVIKLLYNIKKPINKEIYNDMFEQFSRNYNIDGLGWMKDVNCLKYVSNESFRKSFKYALLMNENINILKWIFNERNDINIYELHDLKYSRLNCLKNKEILEFLLNFELDNGTQKTILAYLIRNICVDSIQLFLGYYPNIDLEKRFMILDLDNEKNDIIWVIENFKKSISFTDLFIQCDTEIFEYFNENNIITLINYDVTFHKIFFLDMIRYYVTTPTPLLFKKIQHLIKINRYEILEYIPIVEIISEIRVNILDDGFGYQFKYVKNICDLINSTNYYRKIDIYKDIIFHDIYEKMDSYGMKNIKNDSIIYIINVLKNGNIKELKNIIKFYDINLFRIVRKILICNAIKDNDIKILQHIKEIEHISNYEIKECLCFLIKRYSGIQKVENIDINIIKFLFENNKYLSKCKYMSLGTDKAIIKDIYYYSIKNNRIDILNFLKLNIDKMKAFKSVLTNPWNEGNSIFHKCITSCPNSKYAQILLDINPGYINLVRDREYIEYVLQNGKVDTYFWMLSHKD